MNIIKNKFFAAIFILFAWLVFSYPFFFKGLVPYPSLYQANAFPPWSAYGIYQGPIKNSAMPDVITQIYPWKKYSIDTLKQGEIPLWNPYSFSGTPHLANYQSALLFPLNLIFFLPFSFAVNWSILVLLQPLIAGVGMLLFLRSCRLSIHSSILGAISFMFCGFIVTWMSYATLAYAILFLPLALFFVNKFLESFKTRYAILMSLTVPVSLFAGHFQTSLYFLGALFAYIFFLFLTVKTKKKAAFLMLFFFCGILIAMPQVLPSIELYTNSVREEIIARIGVIPLMYIPALFAPDFYGNPVTRNDWFGHYAEWNGYAGAIPLILATFSSIVLWRKDKRILFFLALAAFSFLLAFNTPINYLFFILKIPVLSTSAASRIIVLFSFSVAVLAAFGFDPFINFIKKATLRKLLIISTLVFLIIIALWAVPFLKLLGDIEKNTIAQSNLKLPSLILFAFVFSTGVFFVFKKSKIIVSLFIILILVIVSFDLLRFVKKWQPFDPKDFVFPDTGVSKFYESNKTEQRYLGAFTAENAVYYKIQSLEGYDPLFPERYGEFIKYIYIGKKVPSERSLVKFPKDAVDTEKAFNFLGVSYISHKKSDTGKVWSFPFWSYADDRFELVYEDEAYQVFKNNRAYGRAFVVGDYEVEKSDERALSKIFSENTDLKTKAILEKDPQISKNERINSKSKIISYEPTEIDIEAETDSDSILVLTDNYYPGWKAYINGEEKEILRTDYSFRGVAIPKGKSHIKFVYDPNSFRYGVYLAVLGLLSVLLLSLIYNKKLGYGKN